MADADLAIVHKWLIHNTGTGLGPQDVPGASAAELAALATLGRLAGQLLLSFRPLFANANELLDFCGGSEEILQWFAGTDCPEPPQYIVDAARRLVIDEAEDGLARLYSNIVSRRRRRQLGTFFTPKFEVIRMMAALQAQGESPAAVIDVGAGVGIYTVTATQTWPEALVYAVDVNPVTLGLLAVRVAALEPNTQVRLVLHDYARWVSANWTKLPSPRLILGNPPYTRMQLLPSKVRADLLKMADGMVGRRASLATLMTAITLNLLGPRDGLCLLLPAQWLESDYAAGLRTWLWESTNRRVELRLFSSDLFADAEVDTVSLTVGPAAEAPSFLWLQIDGKGEAQELKRHGPCPEQWRKLFEPAGGVLGQGRHGPVDARRGSTTPEVVSRGAVNVELTSMCLGDDGNMGVAPATTVTSMSQRTNERSRLGNFAKVQRGVATGANWFFVLSEEQRRDRRLPLSSVRPLIRRLRTRQILQGVSWTHPAKDEPEFIAGGSVAELSWLLVTGPEPRSKSVRSYLEFGRENGAHQTLLSRQRPNWFDLSGLVRNIDVAISPMSKGTFRLLAVPSNYCILNNLYGLTWHSKVSEPVRRQVLDYLDSPIGQLDIQSLARSQAKGLIKIEPRALLQLPVQLNDSEP